MIAIKNSCILCMEIEPLSRHVVLYVIRIIVTLFLCSTLTVKALTACGSTFSQKICCCLSNSEVYQAEVDRILLRLQGLFISENISISTFCKILFRGS